MLNIFTDKHHDGLLYSLHLLFEKRLGFKLFRPIGMEWFTEGWWQIGKPYGESAILTANQYLELNSIPADKSLPLNNGAIKEEVQYLIPNLAHDFIEKAITLEQFKNMKIDIIIASIPDHAATYKRLRDLYQPKAKIIFQMGNMFNEIQTMIQEGFVTNLMASTIDFPVPKHVNTVFYYQEQPLVDFKPLPEIPAIKSFVHLLPKLELFYTYKGLLGDYFQFKAYGGSCPDGVVNGIQNVYKEMQSSTLIYHVKPRGDGYGWNWHSAFMLGRPVITNFSDYKDKLGGRLFVDGLTGFDLERRTVQENAELIRKEALVDSYPLMAEVARKKFFETVNYEHEGNKILKFLENLK